MGRGGRLRGWRAAGQRAEEDPLRRRRCCFWSGRRDHALILLAVQTGLRLSELTNLMPADLQLGAGANVHVIGKGRKERCTRCWCCWSVWRPSRWVCR